MNKSLMRSRWAAFGAAVAVTFGGGAVWVANATLAPDNTFYSIVPCRLLDTRTDGDQTATNLGIRRAFVQNSAQGGTANNDITVIFDPRAKQDNSKFTLKIGDDLPKPIMGRCDESFKTGDLSSVSNPTALLLNVTALGSFGTTTNSDSGKARSFTADGYLTVYPWTQLSGTGSGLTGRPTYSNVNPVNGLSSVSNNVTVQLAPITSAVTIPNVACKSGDNWGNSNCMYSSAGETNADRLKAFRVFNANGNVHLVIDVLGYYEQDS